MAITLNHQLWTLIFGILGNAISVLVYLAPMPTFYRIYKKKSTESFQSLPYQMSLLSCMLWLYYALLRQKAVLLITINSFGCVVETLYISIYVAYASKDKRVSAIKLFVATNVVAFPCVLLVTRFLLHDVKSRNAVLGWICVAVSIAVYAAPLNVLARVIRTRSVEYMPFTLSLFLTINAVMWFAFGLLLKDIFVALPNVAGFFFGTMQMIVYGIYKRMSLSAAETDEEQKIAVDMSEMKPKETDAGSDTVKEKKADEN